LFLKYTVLTLAVLRTTLPKLRIVGDRVVAVTPVPERGTLWAVTVVPVVIARTPGRAPVALGVRLRAMVQLAPAGNVPGFGQVEEPKT
jgi:hypothetical protein